MATAREGFRYEVMISYKHADSKEFAIELEMYLKQHNKKVFRDENEIRAGQHITKKCEQAIRVSQVFLPIFSKHYCEGASDDEFCFNKDKVKRPVVPVVIEGGIIPRNYKMGDTSQVRIQADFKENKEKYFKRILDGVDAHLSAAATSSSLVCDCGLNAKELTVKKEGPNKGRIFFNCPKPEGSQCGFFKWADEVLASNLQTGAAPRTSSSVVCDCGLTAVELIAKNNVPNKGRKFFKCPKQRNRCRFFEWADDIQAYNSQPSGGLGQERLEGSACRKRKQPPTCSRCGDKGHTKRSKRCALSQQTNN